MYIMYMKKAKSQEKTELVKLVESIVVENKEGINKLAEEDLAHERRNESVFKKKFREIKRDLGLRKSGAKKISLQ